MEFNAKKSYALEIRHKSGQNNISIEKEEKDLSGNKVELITRET